MRVRSRGKCGKVSEAGKFFKWNSPFYEWGGRASTAYEGWKSITLLSYSIPLLWWYSSFFDYTRVFNKLNLAPWKGTCTLVWANVDYSQLVYHWLNVPRFHSPLAAYVNLLFLPRLPSERFFSCWNISSKCGRKAFKADCVYFQF